MNFNRKQLLEKLKDSDIKSESDEILRVIKSQDYNILLDINGKMNSSVELSKFIDNIFTNINSNITFIIGGSDGVDDRVKDVVNYKISFNKYG